LFWFCCGTLDPRTDGGKSAVRRGRAGPFTAVSPLSPELEWLLGHAFALLLMVICVIVPYLYFKYRRWL
jgi:hypothetical protein